MRKVETMKPVSYYITEDNIQFTDMKSAMKYEWQEFIAKKIYIVINKMSDKTRKIPYRYVDIFSTYELGEKARKTYPKPDDYYTDIIYLNERFWEEEWNEWNKKRITNGS